MYWKLVLLHVKPDYIHKNYFYVSIKMWANEHMTILRCYDPVNAGERRE